jgi:pyruvate/2-oxoglutarate dehydrogenase complex dihydrolipoamide acyltransferase (E2) component
MTDKATVEIPSPVDGTVKRVVGEAGDILPVGVVCIEFEVEGEDDMEAPAMGSDPTDDMMSDIQDMGDEGGEGDEEDGDVEDRVADLEDALDELKAEFEDMMAGDEGDDAEMPADDEDMDDADMDEPEMDNMDEPEEESMAYEASDEEVEEESDEDLTPTEQMREYVEKISATMGDNGANTKSAVAGKNDMGGSASNLVQGKDADTKGTTGGLAANTSKEENAGNVNVPGGKASKSLKGTKGHGAEKKGQGDTAANKKPVIG